MNTLSYPAIALMNRLADGKKFMLLGAIYLIAIAGAMFSLYVNLNQVAGASQRQLEGFELIKPISRAVQLMQQHRGLSTTGRPGGNKAIRAQRDAKEIEVAEAFNSLEQQLPTALVLSEDWVRLKTDWRRLQKDWPDWTVDANFSAHTGLIDRMLIFEQRVADDYGLTFNSDKARFYLIDTAINKLPLALERLGQIRALGVGILTHQQILEYQKAEMIALIAELRHALKFLSFNLEKSGQFNPEIRNQLLAADNDIVDSAYRIVKLVQSNVVTEHFATTPDDFFNITTAAIDQGYRQMDRILLPKIEALIAARVQHSENELRVNIGIALLLLLVAHYFLAGLYFSMIGSIQPLTRSTRLFVDGDYVGDIAGLQQADADLRIAAIAFEIQDAMIITDANQIILRVNQAFSRVTGYSAEEVIGRTPALLKSGHQDAEFYRAMWESLARDGYWQSEIWNRRKCGNVYPERISITAVTNAEGKVVNYVATFDDISQYKKAEETIHDLVFYDSLTKLPNRRLLLERLKHSIEVERRDGKQLALMMLDLDRFKIINDSLGYLAGDELLQQVASRIATRLRKVDTVARLRKVDLLARLGGDEFIMLLEDITHTEDAARVAEQIIAILSKPFYLSQGNEICITASIGISLYPQHGDNPEELINYADVALHKAKDEGRSCFAYYSEDLTLTARGRIAMEARLRKAIELHELRVFYQPQVDIANGRIIGAEALVRWLDPIEGLVAPAQFIPLAEETGLILEIGAWVLQETCRQGRQWLDAGVPPLTLAVNVSAHQFRRSDVSALVTTVLTETGFPARQLELEMTESGLMENQKVMELLNNLRALGVRFAIDDFGTGYSSLAYLKHFPLDLLKIDKGFIDDIPHQQDDMEIAATIIAMGHMLGFKVLAEGVETAEQLAFLQDKGCDAYQGYFKSKPLPADEFTLLLRTQ